MGAGVVGSNWTTQIYYLVSLSEKHGGARPMSLRASLLGPESASAFPSASGRLFGPVGQVNILALAGIWCLNPLFPLGKSADHRRYWPSNWWECSARCGIHWSALSPLLRPSRPLWRCFIVAVPVPLGFRLPSSWPRGHSALALKTVSLATPGYKLSYQSRILRQTFTIHLRS